MASPVRSPGPSGGARVHLLLGLFALFVVASLLTRWLSLVVEILDMDEAAHAVGSWVLLDGGRLYTDFVDNKPPLLYGYYALAQLLLGRGLLSVHLFTAVVTVPLAALAASSTPRTRSRLRERSSGRPATCCRGSSRRRLSGGRGEPPPTGTG